MFNDMSYQQKRETVCLLFLICSFASLIIAVDIQQNLCRYYYCTRFDFSIYTDFNVPLMFLVTEHLPKLA